MSDTVVVMQRRQGADRSARRRIFTMSRRMPLLQHIIGDSNIVDGCDGTEDFLVSFSAWTSPVWTAALPASRACR